MSVHRLVREMLHDLTPSSARIGVARTKARSLIADLQRISWEVEVRDARLFGSIAQGTALSGFNDIDYLVVLEPTSLTKTSGEPLTPSYAIGRFAEEITHIRAGVVKLGNLVVEPQRHSVGVTYPGQDFRVDLVPAIRLRGRGYRYKIPSKRTGGWIETRPFAVQKKIAAAQPKYADAIRLLKAWRRARGGKRKGYHLPSHAIATYITHEPDATQTTPPLELVRAFFEHVSEAGRDLRRPLVLRGSAERAAAVYVSPVSGKNLLARRPTDSYAEAKRRKNKLVEACDAALEELDEIEAEMQAGRTGTARRGLRKLFGV